MKILKLKRKEKKGKIHRTAKAQCRGRGLWQQLKMWLRKKNLKSLITFYNAIKIDNYNKVGKEKERRKKYPKESTEQVET